MTKSVWIHQISLTNTGKSYSFLVDDSNLAEMVTRSEAIELGIEAYINGFMVHAPKDIISEIEESTLGFLHGEGEQIFIN